MRLRRSGIVGLSTYFDNEGSPQYPDAELRIQTQAGVAQYEIANTGGGFSNWTLVAGESDAITQGIDTGARFNFGITHPSVAVAVAGGLSHAARAAGVPSIEKEAAVAGSPEPRRARSGDSAD